MHSTLPGKHRWKNTLLAQSNVSAESQTVQRQKTHLLPHGYCSTYPIESQQKQDEGQNDGVSIRIEEGNWEDQWHRRELQQQQRGGVEEKMGGPVEHDLYRVRTARRKNCREIFSKKERNPCDESDKIKTSFFFEENKKRIRPRDESECWGRDDGSDEDNSIQLGSRIEDGFQWINREIQSQTVQNSFWMSVKLYTERETERQRSSWKMRSRKTKVDRNDDVRNVSDTSVLDEEQYWTLLVHGKLHWRAQFDPRC